MKKRILHLSLCLLMLLFGGCAAQQSGASGTVPEDTPVSTAPHCIAIFENNAFKELKPASDFPEDMRCRNITEKRDTGEIVERMVPVARIEVFLMDKNGKPATPDTAVRITVHDYALDGTLLHSNTMTKNGGGPDPKPWPDAAALANIAIVEQYDLLPGSETTRATASFTKEEVQQAKDIAFARLKAEGIDGYAPSLRLVDAKQPDKIIVILAGLFDGVDKALENGELLGRTYHIQDGKLIRVIKRYPDGRAMETRIEFTDEEMKKAAEIAATHMRETFGWRDDEFEVSPYEYGKRSESESYLLKFIAEHNDDKNLQRAGGGKSRLVIMNMNSLEVVRVLAFQ